jgi:hypothetical protein
VKAFALVALLISSTSGAQDAPKIVVLAKGEAAPEQGLFLPEPVAIEQAKRVKHCEAEREKLKENPKAADVVLWAFAGLAVGAAVGAATVYAVKK